VLLGMKLLSKVQESQKPFVHGSYLEPVALRCDGMADGHEEAGQHCTFLSFPFFSLQKPPPLSAGRDTCPTRALLQTMYYMESTASRDSKQAVTKLLPPESNPKDSKSVHVPQLWSMILGTGASIPVFAVQVLTRCQTPLSRTAQCR
jgi:hypothetical protein